MADDTHDPDRRRLLGGLTLALGGCVAAAAATPAVVVLLEPIGKTTVESGSEPVAVGKLSDFPVATPTGVEIQARKRDAWSNFGTVTIGKAYILRHADDTVTVFSNICPHQGCGIDWRPERQDFFCPCHQSLFARDGSAQTGPSQRGLDPLPYEILPDGTLRIAFVRYRLGGTEREQV